MSTVTPRSATEEHLLTVLQMVNEWLRFAEAKNAGLIALAGLSLTGLLSYVGQVDSFIIGAAMLLAAGAALWLAALMLSAYSFIPVTSTMVLREDLEVLGDDHNNLYYYGHLAHYTAETLLVAVGGDPQANEPRLRFESDLADQVIINSRITLSKLHLFSSAMHWWIAGTLIVGAGVLWLVIGKG